MEHQLPWCSKLLTATTTKLTTSAVRYSVVFSLVLLFTIAVPGSNAESQNSFRYAKRLLEVSGTPEQFESTAQQQTSAIIRTYLSIVNMSVDVRLPRHITNSISNCYQQAYAWSNFEDGIADILAQQLSDKEMLLLIDFYRNLGLPPMEIDTFKATLAKVPAIQEISANYIFSQSEGCVEQDASTIKDYLTAIGSPLLSDAAP